jgi:AraC family transcriptional regulator
MVTPRSSDDALPCELICKSERSGFEGLSVAVYEMPPSGRFVSEAGLEGYSFSYLPLANKGEAHVTMPGIGLDHRRANRDNCLLLPPRVSLHSEWTNAGGRLVAFTLSPRFVEAVARQVGLPSPQLGRLTQGPFWIDQSLEALGGLLVKETENRCPHGPAYFEWLASALAATVLSRLHARLPRGVPIHSSIRRAIEYMELHFAEPVSLAELAEQAQLSRSHFVFRFEQSTGYTPHRYLLLARLGHARKLLAQEAMLSLPEIATASGFSDQAHMSRLFRRFFGTTPAAFRRSQRLL